MRPFLIRWLVTTGAVYLTAPLAGLQFESGRCLVVAALLLGVVNAVLRPVILLLSLPFIILTLGAGILMVNAVLLLFVARLVPCFHIESFGQAFWGSILISLVSWLLSAFFRTKEGRVRIITHQERAAPGGMKQARGRVVE